MARIQDARHRVPNNQRRRCFVKPRDQERKGSLFRYQHKALGYEVNPVLVAVVVVLDQGATAVVLVLGLVQPLRLHANQWAEALR